MKRRTPMYLAALMTVGLLLTACQPTGWKPLAKQNGRGVQRMTCSIHYRINGSEHPDHGKAAMGWNFVALIHERVKVLGDMTGVRWIFAGYTHDSYESTRGRTYANNQGVLIELRGPRTWSQPLPKAGPIYTGGIMFFDLDHLKAHRNYPNTMRALIDHELGHQYGLGDMYHDIGGPIDRTQKMGDMNRPWGRGDRDGFRALTKDSLANCERLRRGQKELTSF